MCHIKKKQREQRSERQWNKRYNTETIVTVLINGENRDDWWGKVRHKQISLAAKWGNPEDNLTLHVF